MSDDQPTGPRQGGRVGRYRLGEPLGRGGNATVFRATDDEGRPVAVKVLHPASVGTDEVRRFTREYRALARLDHPCIVRVYETGIEDGYPWIAMELIDGRDLDEELAAWREVPPKDQWERAERILRGLCGALAHIHDRGLIHRDIKPANVLIDQVGNPHLSDFGVVKDHRSNATALTMHGNLVGTIAFMAPEQITDEPVDARTDLYSLGAVLYLMITGRKPIEADSITGFLARHLSHTPPAPSALRPDVPRRLESVCQRLLYKEKSQRFPSARAVLAALDDEDDPDVPPLRGRDDLLATIRERLSALQEGVGGVVALTGADGMGRSFTLKMLAKLARQAEIRVALVDASSKNPITALLRELDPKAAEQPPKQHLRGLAQAVRGRPTILCIDDVDRLSARMLEAIGRLVNKLVVLDVEPLLVLCTARTGGAGVEPFLEGESTGLPAERLPLEGLDREALQLMLRDRGLRGTTGSALARRFLRELGGLPGAVDQQIGALLRSGWLRREDGRLVSTLPLKELARRALPVPAMVRERLEERLDQLDPEALGLAEFLAVIGRPASVDLACQCAGAAPSTAERLVEAGLCQISSESDKPRLTFAVPWLDTTLFERIPPKRRMGMHATIAEAIGGRRSSRLHAEQARHYEASGQPAAAYPLLLKAARHAAREQQTNLVLRHLDRALRLAPAAERSLDPTIAVELRCKLHLLHGEAMLSEGRWKDATTSLHQAVTAARLSQDSDAIGRSVAGLGRAHHRLGAFDAARPFLEEALSLLPESSIERAASVRALADLHLRSHDLDAAESLWAEALQRARNGDAKARAHRGISNLRILQGRLHDATVHLERAENLLHSGGDSRVRAAVLSRSVELDLAAGRYATAKRRAQALVALVERAEIDHRLAEAWLTLLEVSVRTAPPAQCAKALDKATTWLRLNPPNAGALRLRLARCLAVLDQPDQVLAVLPDPLALTPDPVEDPGGQHGALRALATARRQPERAVELAHWCLRRTPPRVILRHVLICLDAGEALRLAGDTGSARTAAKRGLSAMEGEGYDGLRVELLALFARVDPDPRIRDTLDRVLDRVRTEQPAEIGAFLARRLGDPAA